MLISKHSQAFFDVPDNDAKSSVVAAYSEVCQIRLNLDVPQSYEVYPEAAERMLVNMLISRLCVLDTSHS